MTGRRCFYMPLLRSGDLLFNAVVLQQRLVDRTSVSEALEAVRGSVGGMARDLFGHNVTEIASHLLGDPSRADELLHQHTLFGVFRHALSDAVVGRWGGDLKVGRHHSSLQSLGASPSDLAALSAPSLRSCALCISIDRERQGFATWKLTHQVSAIDRCPDHGAPLDTESRPIGGAHARIWPLFLPGENRVRSDVASSLPPSDGYAAYLRLWQRVLTDELTWLKPSAWIQSMEAAVLQLGGLDAAIEAIEADVLRAWGAPIGEISTAIFLDSRVNPIREELSLRSRPRDLARRMLLHGSLDRLGLDLFGCKEGDQRALLLSGAPEKRKKPAHNASVERLRALADRSGLPLASIKLAELDSGFTFVAQALGLNVMSLRNFTATVELDVLQELMDSLQFSAKSWVGSEIARRRRLGGAASALKTHAAPT